MHIWHMYWTGNQLWLWDHFSLPKRKENHHKQTCFKSRHESGCIITTMHSSQKVATVIKVRTYVSLMAYSVQSRRDILSIHRSRLTNSPHTLQDSWGNQVWIQNIFNTFQCVFVIFYCDYVLKPAPWADDWPLFSMGRPIHYKFFLGHGHDAADSLSYY